MFKSLKEKLKGWVKKVEEETKIENIPIEIKETSEKPKFSLKKKISEEKLKELFEDLKITLLQNNIAYSVVDHIENSLKEKLIGENLSKLNLEEEILNTIENVLINPPNIIKKIKDSLKEKSPFVIAFVGINGSGKTTSIAKVANFLLKEKFSICLAAADTFRAAAVEQLEIHGNNLKIPVIKKEYNSDPASVSFEAISYAKKHKLDIVLIDTAGRLNNRNSLMQELDKIIRVAKPNMKLFVGESITGNDATEQAKSFNDLINLDGIILSKADIDEKGGTAISISQITGKPIFFIGTGQGYNDLEIFDKVKILENLKLN